MTKVSFKPSVRFRELFLNPPPGFRGSLEQSWLSKFGKILGVGAYAFDERIPLLMSTILGRLATDETRQFERNAAILALKSGDVRVANVHMIRSQMRGPKRNSRT